MLKFIVLDLGPVFGLSSDGSLATFLALVSTGGVGPLFIKAVRMAGCCKVRFRSAGPAHWS